MTVEAKITTSEVPSKVPSDKKIPWNIGMRTTGSGENYIGGAMFERPVKDGDHPVNGALFIIADRRTGEPKKMPPGKSISGTIKIDSLADWMTTIPNRLEWVAVVGWLERTNEKKWTLHATDKKDHTVTVVKKAPGILDWMKDNPEIVAASTAGAVGLTYVGTK